MPYRLYLVHKDTGKCTGKKRDYPSEEHFKKYGIDTYKRYNWYHDRPEHHKSEWYRTKGKLCFLTDNNKWEEVDQETLNKLLKENE